MRRATANLQRNQHQRKLFYPRSPCGERRRPIFYCRTEWIFYPRSPCGERPVPSSTVIVILRFSIHALLAESDACQNGQLLGIYLFYPRSPCGERLKSRSNILITSQFFYPRSPCGERPYHRHENQENQYFLSTLSLRRATLVFWMALNRLLRFSIHALLAESDEQSASYNAYLAVFYPRSPCGERRLCVL